MQFFWIKNLIEKHITHQRKTECYYRARVPNISNTSLLNTNSVAVLMKQRCYVGISDYEHGVEAQIIIVGLGRVLR